MSIWNLDLGTRRNLETNTMKQATRRYSISKKQKKLSFQWKPTKKFIDFYFLWIHCKEREMNWWGLKMQLKASPGSRASFTLPSPKFLSSKRLLFLFYFYNAIGEVVRHSKKTSSTSSLSLLLGFITVHSLSLWQSARPPHYAMT